MWGEGGKPGAGASFLSDASTCIERYGPFTLLRCLRMDMGVQEQRQAITGGGKEGGAGEVGMEATKKGRGR
jgi:hypothetical protein